MDEHPDLRQVAAIVAKQVSDTARESVEAIRKRRDGGLRKDIRVYVEAELRDYHQTRQDIAELRADILDESPPPADGMPRGSDTSDSTYQRMERLVTCRRLKYMAHVLLCISAVLDSLPPEKMRLVELTYWTKPQTLTPVGIALKLNCGRNTFFRWRDEICGEIARELGLLR